MLYVALPLTLGLLPRSACCYDDSMTTTSLYRSVRKFTASLLLAISLITAVPHSAYADKVKIEDDAHYDGRVQGYEPDVELPSASQGMNWFLLLALGTVCIMVIFKDAKRSHLD